MPAPHLLRRLTARIACRGAAVDDLRHDVRLLSDLVATLSAQGRHSLISAVSDPASGMNCRFGRCRVQPARQRGRAVDEQWLEVEVNRP
jgi:hypothetical protein